MFERFTERARQVVVLSQEEARELQHGHIGTEHLLLGLLREEEGIGARVLEAFDITVERARAQVVRIVGTGQKEVTGQIPFTPRGKKVLEISLREALSMGHNYIGTEHLVLSLCREHEGMAARILNDFLGEKWHETIRNEVMRILAKPKGSWHNLTTATTPPVVEFISASEEGGEGTLTRDLVVPSNLGKIQVQHRRMKDFRGILMGYEWNTDRCTVAYAIDDMTGTFELPRTDLDLA